MSAQDSSESGIETIYELIVKMADARGVASFLISPETGRTLTFCDLKEQVSLLSVKLGELGLTPGDKVAFLMDNGLFTATLFLAAMYGNFVAVPLNVRGGVSQLSYMLDHCDANVVFVADAYAGLIEEVMAGVTRSVKVIPADIDCTAETRLATQRIKRASIPSADNPALLMYTSGSTGQPKAAVHTHRTILAQGRNSISSHQLTSSDRSLLVLPLYHINAECVTLIPTLLSGGSVVVPHKFSVSHFWDWLDDHHCTWSAVVPTIIAQLLDWEDPRSDRRAEAFSRIRFLRTSSAPLSPSLHLEFVDRFKLPLIQAMGSSEAGNVFSNPLPPAANKVGSVGWAWGFEIKIIDRNGVEVPDGEPGEVLMRGTALTNSYYKEPEATAAVFDNEGWLHTGDLAYRDRDRYIFVVGRSKELIIKGGVNIAPRQIDEVLESHPAVREAAAVGIPDHHLGEDLVAFVVLRSGMAAQERELLAFCEPRLGHFKTPTRIHITDDLPKGPSGKVQRLRLLDDAVRFTELGWNICPTSSTNSQVHNGLPPLASSIEQTITGVWTEILAVPRVGGLDNFFALGGDSLLAIQCLARLRDQLPVRLTLSEFFENATIAQQAILVRNRLYPDGRIDEQLGTDQSVDGGGKQRERASSIGSETIPARGLALPYHLSPLQERLWFMEQLSPGVPVYNEAEAARLSGELDVDAMEKALNAVIARHEVLRSTIQTIDGQPMVVVHERWPIRIKKIDLSALADPQRDAEIEGALISEPRIAYRLEDEPGIRATLIRVGPREHIFILMMHHLICDWSSEGVLWREFAHFYRGYSSDQPAPPVPLPIQHGDYAVWQRERLSERNLASDLAFWSEELKNAPALLELPSDRPRPAVKSFNGARQRFRINCALTEAIRHFSRREKLSLFTVFTTALNTLLYRYTGSEDILVGIPMADRDLGATQSLIGFLLHTHALRTRLSGDLTFRKLLVRVQQGVLDLFEHRAVPFDQVVRAVQPERNLSYSPLFEVMLNWRDRDQDLSVIGLEGLGVESVLAESRTSKFDLTFMLTDMGDEIWAELEYSTDLFDEARIVRMFGHYRTLLEAVVADPDRTISELPLLTDAERHQLLVDWNNTAAEYPRDIPLAQLVEEQVERTPEAVAVVFEDSSITYRGLNERANQLAYELRKYGAGPGQLVGMCVERSIDMVVALLAIVKAGAAYVPLDPDLPHARLAYMIEDSGLRLLLTQRELRSSLSFFAGTYIEVDGSNWRANNRENPGVPVTPIDLAYVIYTSGSTGRPKGVQIPRGAVTNFLWSMRGWLQLKTGDTLLAVTTISFDIAGLEVWLPLLAGARCVVACRASAADGQGLRKMIERWQVGFLQATPATWRLLLDVGWQGKPDLIAVCGGEALSRELAAQLGSVVGQLWNLYGPTETTIWSTGWLVPKRKEPVLIGRPIGNTQCYVLDEKQQPAPLGIPGELYIAGHGLAMGYLNRPELTTEKFVSNPFIPGSLMYRTGDLARYRPDGNLECLGRTDTQVKIRGFRIELGEIEAALQQHAGVKQAVVTVHEDTPADKRLVGYLVLSGNAVPDRAELRALLKLTLPDYMVPADYVVLGEIPLTSNGKVDRLGLRAPERGASEDDRYVPPRDELERLICEIWADVLGLRRVGIRDNFFDLGGHSMMAVKLMLRLQEIVPGAPLPLRTVLEAPTVERFTLLLQNGKADQEQFLVRIRPGTPARPPFFFVHGAGGNVLSIHSLAMALPPDLPVYGLQAKGLDGSQPFESVEETARCYVDEIRKVQSHGPYYLCGGCYGGIVAFEMARTLEKLGETVAVLFLIDTYNYAFSRFLPTRKLVITNLRFYVRRFGVHVREFQSLRSGVWFRYIAERLKAMGGHVRGLVRVAVRAEGNQFPVDPDRRDTQVAAGTDLGDILSRVRRASLLAARKFVPGPYGGDALVFRAAQRRVEPYEDTFLGWGPVVRGSIESIEIDGDHDTIFEEPAIRAIAQKIDSKILESRVGTRVVSAPDDLVP